MNIEPLHDCREELRTLSLKATPARLGILKLLEKSEKPLDVAAMIEYLENKHIEADPATVFRIVNLFSEKGLLKPIQLNEGKFRYELSSKADHHHLICEHCGHIQDISDCSLPALEKEIKEKKKFLVKSHSLEFFGLCVNCQK